LGPDVPKISLGGEEWPVPFLSLGRNRKLQPLFNVVASRILAGEVRVADLLPTDHEALVEMAYIALTQAHPTITREEMEEMPIGIHELVGALLTIMAQSKLFTQAAGADPDLPAAHYGRGLLLRDADRMADARAALHRAVTLDPTNSGAWFALGLT